MLHKIPLQQKMQAMNNYLQKDYFFLREVNVICKEEITKVVSNRNNYCIMNLAKDVYTEHGQATKYLMISEISIEKHFLLDVHICEYIRFTQIIGGI